MYKQNKYKSFQSNIKFSDYEVFISCIMIFLIHVFLKAKLM